MAELRFVCVLSIGLSLLLGAPMQAANERRQGNQAISEFHLQFNAAIKFNDVMIPGNRKFRVSLYNNHFVLIDSNTMVVFSSILAIETSLKHHEPDPRFWVHENKDNVILVYLQANKRFEARGDVAKAIQKAQRKKVVAKKEVVSLATLLPKSPNEVELIVNAVSQLRSGIMHCAKRAFKFKQQTDDLQFRNCVCPITRKWRIPSVKSKFRLSLFLERLRSGISFTAIPEGRVRACRVWRGRAPPFGEPAVVAVQ